MAMRVVNWEVFADELRAALMHRYPSIAWRVAPFVVKGTLPGHASSGVEVQARCAGREVALSIPEAVIALAHRDDLLDTIYQRTEQPLSVHEAA
jgi:hypothetical protein